MSKRILSGLAVALLVGCGGGDGDNTEVGGGFLTPTQATPEGVYGGTLSGSTSSDFQALILENGDFWALYGNDMGSIFYVEGFVQGNGTWSGEGSYTSNNIRDFGFFPAPSGTLKATYNSNAKTITGTVTYPQAGTVQLSGGPIDDSLYDYDVAAALTDVTGSWSAMNSLGGSVSMSVNANGTLSVSEGACSGTGTITPRASGKNVFNVSVSFGGAPCLLPNQTATGIAIVYPLATGQTQLVAAITSAARTAGIAVFAIR
jgi:hypothetical protein